MADEDDSVIREIEQDIAEAQQLDFLKTYGPALIGAGALIVAGVAGFQVWNGQQDKAAGAAATALTEASKTLIEDAPAGRAVLSELEKSGPAGYARIAAMRRAGSLIADGDRAAALVAYRSVYADAGATESFRAVARIRAATLSLDESRDDVIRDLGALPEGEGAFSFYAKELLGVAAIKAGDYGAATAIFSELSDALAAPPTVRQRAEELFQLARSASAGVDISRDVSVEDLLGVLDAARDDAAPVFAPEVIAEPTPAAITEATTEAASESTGLAAETVKTESAETAGDAADGVDTAGAADVIDGAADTGLLANDGATETVSSDGEQSAPASEQAGEGDDQ
ncbi:MAG: tetratricopeptide repeat protein [Pseudomonadota bacterium]